MDKVKVLMIDDNVQLIEAVKEYFKSSKQIEIIEEAYDGLDGFLIGSASINPTQFIEIIEKIS